MDIKSGRRAIYDTTVTASWNDLRQRDKRAFLSLIAEPDKNGCSAWHGDMSSGYPKWSRIDREARIQFIGQARRLLAESHGAHLSRLDQVVISCGNPGCMAWDHMDIGRNQEQGLTEEQKHAALANVAGHVPQCEVHPHGNFRACFKRQRSGNVTAWFRCVDCEMDKRNAKNQAARKFKDKRRNF